jgi:hypothetical protein
MAERVKMLCVVMSSNAIPTLSFSSGPRYTEMDVSDISMEGMEGVTHREDNREEQREAFQAYHAPPSTSRPRGLRMSGIDSLGGGLIGMRKRSMAVSFPVRGGAAGVASEAISQTKEGQDDDGAALLEEEKTMTTLSGYILFCKGTLGGGVFSAQRFPLARFS